jgi:hypothetical protein
MGETKFTRSFKNNLKDELNAYFSEKGLPLTAQAEYSVKTNYGKNHIDICILHDSNDCALIGIKIEIISDPYQAQSNREKFRDWVHNSPYRCGGLLHIICASANISIVIGLLRDSYADIRQSKGFLYEFYALNPEDWRASRTTASELLWDDWEFMARLLALAHEVFDL